MATGRWTRRCAPSLARAIAQEVSSSFAATRPAALSRQGARLLIYERLKRERFSQQLWRGLQFDMKCSADCNARIAVEFGHRSRSFGAISRAKELETVGTGEETLEEASRKSVNRPFRRTGSSTVRHLKERGFDDIIEKDKKLRIILSIKDLLGVEPSRSMTILDLGESKDDIGFKGNGRLVAFLKRYPSVFRVHETAEFGKLPWFQFTPEAEAAFDEELEIRKRMDTEVVTKLRKLLMMSSDKSLALSKIAHLGRDLGLPDDFRKSLVYEYPGFFRVVGSKDPLDVEGPKLELVGWSSRLAVTEDEKKAQDQKQEEFGRGKSVACCT